MEQAIRDEIRVCYSRLYEIKGEIDTLYIKKRSLEEQNDALYRSIVEAKQLLPCAFMRLEVSKIIIDALYERKKQAISRKNEICGKLSEVTTKIGAAYKEFFETKRAFDEHASRKRMLYEQVEGFKEKISACYQKQDYAAINRYKKECSCIYEQIHNEKEQNLVLSQRMNSLNEEIESLKAEKEGLLVQLSAVKLNFREIFADMKAKKVARNAAYADVTSIKDAVWSFNINKGCIEGDLQDCIDIISMIKEERTALFAKLDELKAKRKESK